MPTSIQELDKDEDDSRLTVNAVAIVNWCPVATKTQNDVALIRMGVRDQSV